MAQLPLGIREINIPQFETTSGYTFGTLSEALRHEVRERLCEFFDQNTKLSFADCEEAARVSVENWSQVIQLMQALKDY